MKFEVITSVHLEKTDFSFDRFFDFEDPKSAIQFFDKKIQSDEYLSGYIKVQVKKGK